MFSSNVKLISGWVGLGYVGWFAQLTVSLSGFHCDSHVCLMHIYDLKELEARVG